MATVLLVLVVVLVMASLAFGISSLLTGDDPGLVPVEPDSSARMLPNNRSLSEVDLKAVRFDVTLRGYRMEQVDLALRRTAYDVGYKDEMIAVLEAEVVALREGRREDAELLRKSRESAADTAGSGERADRPYDHSTGRPTGRPAGRGVPQASADDDEANRGDRDGMETDGGEMDEPDRPWDD